MTEKTLEGLTALKALVEYKINMNEVEIIETRAKALSLKNENLRLWESLRMIKAEIEIKEKEQK